MNLARRLFWAFVLVSPACAQAAQVAIGVISFDNFIPASAASPGVNTFTISNLTGNPTASGFALPPDFPIYSALILENLQLTVLSGSGSISFQVGDVGPGFVMPLLFPDTLSFSSAQLSATLNQTTLLMSDWSVFQASSPSVNVQLSPISGASLMAGRDFQLITISDVPEPSPFLLISLPLAVGMLRRPRRFCRYRQGKEV